MCASFVYAIVHEIRRKNLMIFKAVQTLTEVAIQPLDLLNFSWL